MKGVTSSSTPERTSERDCGLKGAELGCLGRSAVGKEARKFRTKESRVLARNSLIRQRQSIVTAENVQSSSKKKCGMYRSWCGQTRDLYDSAPFGRPYTPFSGDVPRMHHRKR